MPHQPLDDLFADDSAQPTACPGRKRCCCAALRWLGRRLVQRACNGRRAGIPGVMLTPGGQAMSVAMTGWRLPGSSDRRGYRYAGDPVNSEGLAGHARGLHATGAGCGAAGGFAPFLPDACLINPLYAVGRACNTAPG